MPFIIFYFLKTVKDHPTLNTSLARGTSIIHFNISVVYEKQNCFFRFIRVVRHFITLLSC
jgi:hypothetical protein